MSQPSHNPFQAPIQPATQDPAPPASDQVLDFIGIAKKWEWYRLVYNGILVFETIALSLLLAGLQPISLADLAVAAVLGGLTVNFFFLLGPAIDGYCQWIFDSRSPVFGLIILVLGTLFSMLLAYVTVLGLTAKFL